MRAWVQGLVFAGVVGCGAPAVQVKDLEVNAACGMCVLKMEGVNSCNWAVELEGEYVLATGPAIPLDHQSHAPDGMCNMPRRVVVDGTLKDGQFNATRFDLIPATEVPALPEGGAHKHKH